MKVAVIKSLAAAAIAVAAASPLSARDRVSPSEANLRVPLDIPLLLSGNFGELRNNHFHSGLDFKTQGRVGLPVYAAADGYVSRVVVSPWGFGRAVYITHPGLGLVTVYGHLQSFSTRIATPTRERQYADETFSIDLEFPQDAIPVARGELIGRSGNAGSSGGPHLHMDVRDASTGNALDPLEYYARHIKDNVPPEVRAVALYPREGVVDGRSAPKFHSGQHLKDPFVAWGRVVPGIKAYDKMTGTTNIYGIKRMALIVDGDTVYRRLIDEVDFDNTRAVNTLVEYGDVVRDKSWNMITEQPESRPLASMIRTRGDGSLMIDREREYKCQFILEDHYGNRTTVPFTIVGKRSDIPDRPGEGRLLSFDRPYTIEEGRARVTIPAGTFYGDYLFAMECVDPAPDGTYSALYMIGSPEEPLAGNISISIPVDNDTLPDKRQYCLVRYNGLRPSAIGATYRLGRMEAKVNRFGNYAVMADMVAPKVVAQQPEKWAQRGVVTYKISDNLSGIASYRGEIDGKWALMELDGKTGTLSFKIDRKKWPASRHTIVLTVTDDCGNTTTDTRTF